MHMALSPEHWLDLNALYCNRFHARFTLAGCASNQENVADLRCAGCGGLEEQQRELVRQEPVVFYGEPAAYELEPTQMTQALSGALQEVLDFPLDDHEGTDEQELTGFHYELLALLDDDLEEPEPERKPVKQNPRRFSVFMGRCPRCKGYMVNAPERYGDIRDESVHRCFNCGHRTSLGYQWNRQQGA